MGNWIPVSVIIFTLNEELNLPACLDSVSWCDDVIVVDSFSTDATAKLCLDRGVRWFQHAFEGFGSQRNWALEHCRPKYDWVLILDADERVPLALAQEMGKAVQGAASDIAAFRLKRRLYLWGRWLLFSSLYPTWVVRLVHKNRLRYENRGHSETYRAKGNILKLKTDLIDENLKGEKAWFERQRRYAATEAVYERQKEREIPFRPADLFSSDPLKRRFALKRISWNLPLRPVMYFLYSYAFRLGFLDGWDGWRFCRMKADYQAMIVKEKRQVPKTKMWSLS